MVVNVLLFASYAEAFGAASIQVELPPDARVEDLSRVLLKMAGGRPIPPAAFAVNQSMAALSDRVAAGDEIAVIPPVAGG